MKPILIALAISVTVAATGPEGATNSATELRSLVSTDAALFSGMLSFEIERSFKVKYGDKLVLEVGGGPVEITTSKSKKVKILIESAGGDLKESAFEIKQSGGVVSVIMVDRGYRGRRRNARIKYTIGVPQEFDLDVSASGGRTEIQDIKGEVFVRNSGGRLTLGEIDGNVYAHTSGGSLSAGKITGNGDLSASGGSVRLTDVGGSLKARSSGGRLRFGDVGGSVDARSSGGSLSMGNGGGFTKLRSSGGGIKAGNIHGPLEAESSGGGIRILDVKGDAQLETSGGGIEAGVVTGEVTASTSGGWLMIEGVGGAIDASTSGGRIEVYITKQPTRPSSLRSSGGGVVLHVQEDVKFSLRMDVQYPDVVFTNFDTKSMLADDATTFDGDINGGGPSVKIRTRGNRNNAANIRVLKASSK